MEQAQEVLTGFFDGIASDPRIGATHIALFMALYRQWLKSGCQDPIKVFSRTTMPLAKISSSATYHKVIIELHEYGYLRYEPSFNRKGSKVFIS
jgi:hypothetical protein